MRVNTFIIPIIRGDFIGKCLETLYKYTEKDSFYVYVIDQTNSNEALEKYGHLAHFWIKPYRNLGFSKAVNTGIRLSQTPYITLLNDDVEFINSKWWQGILDTFDMDDKIIAVNPMSPKEGSWGYGYRDDNKDTWQPNEKFVYEGDDKLAIYPKREDGTGFFYKEEFDEDDWDFLLNRNPAWTKDSLCDAIPMWCPVFKREAFEKIGIPDEKFFPGGGEDYDMNARAYSCAWPFERDECDPEYHYRMVGTTKSWVWHHWGKSKDEFMFHNLDEPYFNSRERWNDLDQLWPQDLVKHEGKNVNIFDVWGHGHKIVNGQDVKFPLKRLPTINEDDL
jgi:GT2 family glycosyltransferase